MIAIEDNHIIFREGPMPTHCLPLLRLERCPFCGEGIIRAWFPLPEGLAEINPTRYEGLPAREDYKSAFQVLCIPGYEGLVRRSRLYWNASNQVICKHLHVWSAPSRAANLRDLLHHVRYSFPMGAEGQEMAELLSSLTSEQWEYIAEQTLPQYLGSSFSWGEIRTLQEELSGAPSPVLALMLAECPEGADPFQWRETCRLECARFARDLVTPALEWARERERARPGPSARGERYAQIRPW